MSRSNATLIASHIEPIVQQLVDQEVARLMEPVARRRTAAQMETDEIMSAARAVGELTDRLLQARYAGQGEITARKKLFIANLKLATVMRRHGRLK
ncbi:hypothetical protein [Mesorhizobium sp. J428]|uniref:hypothetical protein n=1 Tax=Mesorhizobium sp. J428 TaxID=2898440 RepID=UPI002151B1ED|nr:hypothetical protein [Mesorhizobium sp. J428]MCR5855964.1 hypothetical protein [Mesorhizobium sp. J428]